MMKIRKNVASIQEIVAGINRDQMASPPFQASEVVNYLNEMQEEGKVLVDNEKVYLQ